MEIATATFKQVLQSGHYLILDTETTGLEGDDQIVEIAIIDGWTKTILNTFVKPTKAIPQAAIEIHGISNELVANAPTWSQVAPLVYALIKNNPLIVYNLNFDLQMLRQSDLAVGYARDLIDTGAMHCAMLEYAALRRVPSKYGSEYRWHKLAEALRYEGNHDFIQNHRAISDCLMTYSLCTQMAFRYFGVSPIERN